VDGLLACQGLSGKGSISESGGVVIAFQAVISFSYIVTTLMVNIYTDFLFNAKAYVNLVTIQPPTTFASTMRIEKGAEDAADPACF
jgi:hypothetical protein